MHIPSIRRTLQTLALTFVGTALAAGTPAGTLIQNRALLEFTPEGGPAVTVPTPEVTTTVAPVCAVSALPNGTVAAPGQTARLLPGEGTTLRYTLTNSGNTANTVSLRAQTDAASQFTPTGLSIHMDANGNGVIDPNEPAITSLTLPADGAATLLVDVKTPASGRGNAYVNLVAGCATNATGRDGERDDNNIALVNLGEPPALVLNKTFTPDQVTPGALTDVRITARNTGAGASRPVTVTDFLNTPDMQDFVFQSGSARILEGAGRLEYSADGTTWSATETTPVKAVRAVTDSLAPNATLTLTFKLATPANMTGTRRNVAQLRSGTLTVDAPADITLRYRPSIALGPIRNPQALPGGELSPDDKQIRQYGLLGEEVCFPHTVQNLGDRPDSITITGRAVIGEAEVRFTEPGGTPIAEPFVVPNLAPQATRDFNACYLLRKANTSSAGEALRVDLTARSSLGASDNLTADCVLTIAPNTLSPVKSGSAGDLRVVQPGQTITYTLTFRNTQSFPLTNVVIRDNLRNILIRDADGNTVATETLQFVSADNGGTPEGQEVVWRFAKLNPGETLTLTVVATVPSGTRDGALVRNTFTVTSSEATTPVESNPVINPVFDPAHLTIVKTSTPAEVTPGQDVTYTFTVTNTSDSGYLNSIQIEDVLPAALTYVEGSSLLGNTPITPTVEGRKYTWTIPGLAPRAAVKVSFRATVALTATDGVINSAIAKAVSGGGEIVTPPSTVRNVIKALPFGANNADIVGYVFMDMNRNGIYEPGTDIPCLNARVILANGRIALTDAQGRYHFQNVREGSAALRLDPNSVAAAALQMPQDAGRPGSRLVYVRNLTSVDFPLAPNGGDIAVIRDTTLRMSSTLPGQAASTLTVRKQVFTTEEVGVYRVQLILNSQPELKDLKLTDPLPTGATLVDGHNELTYDTLPSGERAVTYRFRWTGDPKGAVTDPTASWRY